MPSTKQTTKTSGPRKAPKGQATATHDPYTDILKAFGFGNFANMGTAWFDTMGEMGGEIASFVAERIQEDIKTQHEILHCTDPAELQEIQVRFLKTAFEQYSAETGKLVELGQEFLTSAHVPKT